MTRGSVQDFNKGEVIRQIGNAWPGETATALCSSVLAPKRAA